MQDVNDRFHEIYFQQVKMKELHEDWFEHAMKRNKPMSTDV